MELNSIQGIREYIRHHYAYPLQKAEMCPDMKALVEDFYQYSQEESLKLQLYFGKFIDRQEDIMIACPVPPDIAQLLAPPV